MLNRRFGKTGWDVSAIGLGTWNIGNQWGEMDDATAEQIVKAARDGGMNLFDTAESYGIPNGLSEIRLGKAMKSFRNDIYVVSKIGHWGLRTGQIVPKTTVDMIRVCAHACCGRLRTDWLDVVLCHEKDIQDPSVYVESFEVLKKEGFIREYGISTDDLSVLKRFVDMSDGACSVVELNYSLLNKTPEDGLLSYCAENDLGILIRGPLSRGILSGRYDRDTVFTDTIRSGWNKGQAERDFFEERMDRLDRIRAVYPGEDLPRAAIRYVITNSDSTVAIPGATSTAQAESNAAAGAELMPEDLYAQLREVR